GRVAVVVALGDIGAVPEVEPEPAVLRGPPVGCSDGATDRVVRQPVPLPRVQVRVDGLVDGRFPIGDGDAVVLDPRLRVVEVEVGDVDDEAAGEGDGLREQVDGDVLAGLDGGRAVRPDRGRAV